MTINWPAFRDSPLRDDQRSRTKWASVLVIELSKFLSLLTGCVQRTDVNSLQLLFLSLSLFLFLSRPTRMRYKQSVIRRFSLATKVPVLLRARWTGPCITRWWPSGRSPAARSSRIIPRIGIRPIEPSLSAPSTAWRRSRTRKSASIGASKISSPSALRASVRLVMHSTKKTRLLFFFTLSARETLHLRSRDKRHDSQRSARPGVVFHSTLRVESCEIYYALDQSQRFFSLWRSQSR